MSPEPENYQIDFTDQAPNTGYQIDFTDQPKQEGFLPTLGRVAQRFPVGTRLAAQGFAVGGINGALSGFTRGIQEDANPTPQRVGHGVSDAIVAGFQGSATGLINRGRLPDVVLDPQHAKWYEKLVASGSQMVSELPEMIGGALGVGALSLPTGPGAIAAGGAAAFAVPTAIRTALTEAYSKGEVTSAGDFLNRAGIVIKATGKDALVGGLTAGTGALVGKAVSPLLGKAVAAGTIGETTGKVLEGAATMGTEGTVMTVAPAALEGRLPEKEDFMNAAILMGGMKAAHGIAGKLRTIYAQTGVEPIQVAGEAKFDPTILEDVKAPVETAPEIPRAYQPLADQQAAQDAVPGLAGEVAKEFFGPIVRVEGEPSPTQVNYKYINTPEQVNGALDRMSTLNEAAIQTQRRGTVTWEQTQQEVGQHVAELLGSSEPFKPREPGTPAGAAELLARKQMLEGASLDMAAQAQDIIRLGPKATPEQTAAFLASIDRAAMIQAEFLGARAEAGRALNILKETKVTADRALQVQNLMQRFRNSPEELARMLADMDNPASALKFASEVSKANNWDKVVEAWKAGIVSGPITHIKKFLGNLTLTALHPIVDAVAATGGLVTGAKDRVRMTEPLARVTGNLMGVADGLKVALSTLLDRGPDSEGMHAGAIEGTLGQVVRTPFRLLGADGALFRTVNERGEAYALGARHAAEEGLNPLTQEWRQRVAELANNPMEADIERIKLFGERATFHAPMGVTTEKFASFVNTTRPGDVPVLKFLFPFIGTPANIFKEMARLTPLAPMVPEWKAAWKAGGVDAHMAAAEVALGTGISALVASLALGGNISGNGDPDPARRRVQLASGWQPYSVKLNGTWYSYQNFHPVGTAIGMTADMAEVWKHMTPDEQDQVPRILGTAFANSITNQTFLVGIASFVDALAQPDRKAGAFIQKLAGGAVPNIVGQTAQLTDPFKRQIDSIRSAVQSRIPGLREMLPVQRDPFGEPIPNDERVGYISPVTMKDQSTDKVRTEAARLGIGASLPPKSIQLPSAGVAKGGKVELTPEQRDVFGDVAGHMAYRIMDQMVNGPTWDGMPDLVKERAFKTVFERSHELGKAAALSDEQRQVEIQRITREVTRRLAR